MNKKPTLQGDEERTYLLRVGGFFDSRPKFSLLIEGRLIGAGARGAATFSRALPLPLPIEGPRITNRV
jgi:hypothetical protein